MQRALPIFLAVTSVITNNERLYGPPPDRPARPLAHAMKSSRAAQRSDNQLDRARVLEVRIHLPPAESQQTFGPFRVVAIHKSEPCSLTPPHVSTPRSSNAAGDFPHCALGQDLTSSHAWVPSAATPVAGFCPASWRERYCQRPYSTSRLVSLQSMVRLPGDAGDRVVHASAVPHPEPHDPACRYAAEDSKANPCDFKRPDH